MREKMNKFHRKIKNIKNSNKAVSEVLGTILLLGIAVAIFSLLYIIVIYEPFDTYEPYPTIIATVEGNNIIYEHRGGDSLSADSFFNIKIGSNSEDVLVGDLLRDNNNDGEWNIGEKLVYEFEYSLGVNSSDNFGVDIDENRVIMQGTLDIKPETDIGISIEIDNTNPFIGDVINVIITVTNYKGDMNASGIKIGYLIPEGLKYQGHTPPGYNYDNATGIWSIDESVPIRGSISLVIQAEVIGGVMKSEPTQLAMVLDGSSSITSSNWNLIVTGLSNALQNSSIFPHDGSVELSVIQFGERSPPRARLEIDPIVVTETNYGDIADDIEDIDQMVDYYWWWGWQRVGYTPMDCGLRLAADILSGNHSHGSSLFDPNMRQVVNLVTDGKPNCEIISGSYDATYLDDYDQGKSSTELQRSYLLDQLEFQEGQDEFDCLAIGSGPEIDWLKENIVWPQPGHEAPPYNPGSGWVNHTLTFEDFEKAVSEMFRVIFTSIKNTVELVDLDADDPNPNNNVKTITITPKDN